MSQSVFFRGKLETGKTSTLFTNGATSEVIEVYHRVLAAGAVFSATANKVLGIKSDGTVEIELAGGTGFDLLGEMVLFGVDTLPFVITNNGVDDVILEVFVA